MPTLVATCPHCRPAGAPDPAAAVGRSAICPKCGSNYVVGSVDRPAPKPVPEAAEAPPPAPAAAPARAAPTDVGLVVALAALTLVGPAVLASQLPYGRVVAAVLAAAGVVGGVVALGAEGRARLAGAAAVALHALLLLVVLLLPSWLGLEAGRAGTPDDDGPSGPVAAGHGTGITAPADWVDAGTASWKFRDVVVTVRSVTAGPVELTGPDGMKRTPKGDYLRVTLRLANEGTAGPVEPGGWSADQVSLTTPAGKPVRAAGFDRGWEPAGVRPPAAVYPGKSAEMVFVFEAPSPRPDHLRLELPGAGVGVEPPVRFRIAGSFVTRPRP
ncbi:MAG: hypothetical protein C0501_26545 [Isosphaera sp.]|nr:hypothetical protein [Isosphaera sp.]